MDHDFWHSKWALGHTAFHQSDYNHFLVRHFDALNLRKGDAVFVPLCGKTKDIHWLLEQGYQVIGCELNESAVNELFAELNLTPDIQSVDGLVRYSASSLVVLLGDFFLLKDSHIEGLKAVYDRAALVALPFEMRIQYTQHLIDITHKAPQLLITCDYDQSKLPGPPFAVTDEEVRKHYHVAYKVEAQEVESQILGMKGKADCVETCWALKTI